MSNRPFVRRSSVQPRVATLNTPRRNASGGFPEAVNAFTSIGNKAETGRALRETIGRTCELRIAGVILEEIRGLQFATLPRERSRRTANDQDTQDCHYRSSH